MGLGQAIRKHTNKLKARQLLQKVLEEGMCFSVPHLWALTLHFTGLYSPKAIGKFMRPRGFFGKESNIVHA